MKTFNTFNNLGNMCGFDPERFSKLLSQTISQELIDIHLSNENISKHDIGIGYLIMDHNQERISYKFIPKPEFEKMLVDSLKKGESPLIVNLEWQLDRVFSKVYKELL